MARKTEEELKRARAEAIDAQGLAASSILQAIDHAETMKSGTETESQRDVYQKVIDSMSKKLKDNN